MKNNHNDIQQARTQKLHKALNTDILVTPEVVRYNVHKLSQRPRKKRRIDYSKKIMNDPLIFNA